MNKRTEFHSALKDAMKKKDQIALSTVRLILAAVKDRDITAREKGGAECIDDSQILSLLQSMVKQRQDSSKIYSEAGRDDLAEREEMEIDVIKQFLPQQLNEEEVSDVIKGLIETLEIESIRDMGKIMAALKSDYAGKVDMGKAGGFVKKLLS